MLDINNKTSFLFIESSQLSAKENMQIDKEIFDNFDVNSKPIFRIYSWSKNSCTIGISQKFENLKNLDKYEDTYSKRITGGGVLFHDEDISYSLTIPSSFMKNLSVKKSYEKISIFLISFYNFLGLDVRYAKDDPDINLSKSDYCQIGFEPYDLVCNGKKIGGNAQRRDKNTIFQHGSIPLKTTVKQDIYGYSLEDFDIKISKQKAKELLINSFKNSFNIEFI